MGLKIPTEIYSRVVGYFRPTKQWNKGKQEEYKDRKVFTNNSITKFLKDLRLKHSKEKPHENK